VPLPALVPVSVEDSLDAIGAQPGKDAGGPASVPQTGVQRDGLEDIEQGAVLLMASEI